MIQPTFDQYGDPTDETLDAIAKWPHSDPDGWFAFVLAAWTHNCGAIRYDDKFVVFATGGWSGNESIIAAMCDNDGTQRGRDAEATTATETRCRRSLERMVSLIARWRVVAESARITARADAERGDKTWEGTMTMRAMAYEDCAAQLEGAGNEANARTEARGTERAE